MKIWNLALVLCSLVILTSCTRNEQVNNASYEIIKEGHLSYSDEDKIPKQYKVFQSENEWLAFILQIERVNPDRAEDLKKIDLNFSTKNIVIIIGEFFNYCCSEVSIKRVYTEDKKIIVDFEESGPGMAAALSQAYLVLEVSKKIN